MSTLNDGFTNSKGITYNNIRDIHFDNREDLYHNIGKLIAETEFDSENPLFTSSFKRDNGVYIFRSNNDSKKALRVFQDYADYKYTYHDDDKLVSQLQERQKLIKLTDFPTGIVTIENSVVGQEIPYYDNFDTIANFIKNNKNFGIPTSLYIEVLKILKELFNNGIVYSDVHAKNFMFNLTALTLKLIDFESQFVHFDEDGKYITYNMITNLKAMIYKINSLYGIQFKDDFKKTENLDQIEDCVQEQHYLLLKK